MIVISHNDPIKVIEDLLSWLVLFEPSVLLFSLIKFIELLYNFLIKFSLLLLGCQYEILSSYGISRNNSAIWWLNEVVAKLSQLYAGGCLVWLPAF